MANDLWRTPPEVFAALNAEFNFAIDIASDHGNALCDSYYTERDNSLELDWASLEDGQGWIWCNPPYSNPMPWVGKAIESQAKGRGVVMLLNDDMSVGWAVRALRAVSEVRHITAWMDDRGKYHSGRLAFLDASGKPVNGNNKGQVIFVFNPYLIGTRHVSHLPKNMLMSRGAKLLERQAA